MLPVIVMLFFKGITMLFCWALAPVFSPIVLMYMKAKEKKRESKMETFENWPIKMKPQELQAPPVEEQLLVKDEQKTNTGIPLN